MIAAHNLPSLSELNELIDSVPRYPISAVQLTNLATDEEADPRVVNFYKAFPRDQIFDDADDLASRSEVLEIISEDEQPQEIILSPQD